LAALEALVVPRLQAFSHQVWVEASMVVLKLLLSALTDEVCLILARLISAETRKFDRKLQQGMHTDLLTM
jgi:hypothetical protein